MRITQWGEFGILASLYLGKHPDRATIGAQEIAQNLSIPLQYTQQILQRLRKGGIIESVRGPHGGYKLAAEPSTLTLRQILEASEGATFEVICDVKPIFENCGAETVQCGLHGVWKGLKDTVDQYLSAQTLEAVIAGTGENFFERPLVGIGRTAEPEPVP